MLKNDWDFLKKINQDIKARSIACDILGVDETADMQQIKRAYRLIAMQFHPDKNMDDPDADKKFILVKCAYELLTGSKAGAELLKEISMWPDIPVNDKYKLDNPWGHFLWWREKFFDSEKRKADSDANRSSCI